MLDARAPARPEAAALHAGIPELFEDEPEEWRDHIKTIANELTGTESDEED